MDVGRRVVDLVELMIAVWNGQAAQGLGGTADVVRCVHDIGRDVTIVCPPGVSR